MKRLFVILSLALFGMTAWSQTPEEIVSRMEKEMEKFDDKNGMALTMDVKIPIVGSMSTRLYELGDKMRMEGKAAGVEVVGWSDGVTDWTYISKNNQLTIDNAKPKDSKESGEENLEMLEGIEEGYDLTLQSEDENAWYILCKKKKTNKDKDDPKSIDLTVQKGTYLPLSFSTTMKGVKMTIRDISFGVSEEMVTFNPDKYPNATIVDKRGESKDKKDKK